VKRNELTRALLKTYRLLGAAALLASFVTLGAILAVSSLNGLLFHQYAVSIFTNVYGENWPEFLLLLISIPSVVLMFRDVTRAA